MLKTENNVQCKNNGIHVPMSSEVASGNFWFDNENFSKWCVEDAVSNPLCQLLIIMDAAKFKQIAICNGEQLITAMNEQLIPKKCSIKNWTNKCCRKVHMDIGTMFQL